ncbi:hypothetical protein LCGC14_3163980, partial [marine sediment metagenome]
FKKEEKPKQTDSKLSLENIKVGDIISDSTRNSIEWKIDDDLIELMRMYEQDTKKSAIYRGKITGRFLDFKEKKSKKSN